MINSDDAERILVEVTTQAPPARKDTPAQADFREKMVREVAAIRAKKGIVDVPAEIP